MAEFALVLPFLAVVTFGTIEVALYLQQQSNLNAAAFMAARSSSVLGGNLAATKAAVKPYSDVSPPWVGQAVGTMKVTNDMYTLRATTDRFSGLISGLTNGEITSFDTMTAGASLPLEYDPKKYDNAKTGPKSRSLFNYRVVKTEEAVASKAVLAAAKTIEKVQKTVADALPVIKIDPTPKPAVTPKPAAGTKPPVVVKPPIAVKTPQPAQTIPLPDIKALQALKATGPAFQTTGAVVENPKDHGKANSGSFTSLFYLSSNFETKGDKKARWTTGTVAEELKGAIENVGSQNADLRNTCIAVNKFIKVAETNPLYAPYVKGFEGKVKPLIKTFNDGVDKEYKTRDQMEKGLFR